MKIPYGDKTLEFDIDRESVSVFHPKSVLPVGESQDQVVRKSLKNVLDGKELKISPDMRIGIGINDQSRPIPHHVLLPELLNYLFENGAKKENITFFIATGTHKPITDNLFPLIVDENTIQDYKIVSHDCDNQHNLIEIGQTTRNSPVSVNRSFYESDIRIVVGNIESHHFMGFSGGYKTASIGLTSRETITKNHALLPDPNAKMGLFSTNPMRQEVEEIGRMIGVDFALNVVISPKKEILASFWGDPSAVIKKGIEYIREEVQLNLGESLHQFDLVIASPGGYPKDINFYQSQKALTHACLFAKDGGKIILAAECRDGFGSEKFETFISNHLTVQDVISDFESMVFEIGPHKAYQLAKQIMEHEISLVSSMKSNEVESLKLLYEPDLHTAIDQALDHLSPDARIAILPYATHTMPVINE